MPRTIARALTLVAAVAMFLVLTGCETPQADPAVNPSTGGTKDTGGGANTDTP